MNLDSILVICAAPFFVHSAFMFFQAFWHGSTQYSDFSEIEVGPYQRTRMHLFLGLAIDPSGFTTAQVCRVAVAYRGVLRRLGIIPLVLYLLVLFLVLAQDFFSADFNLNVVIRIVLITASVLQLLYLGVKMRSRMSEMLKCLHPEYRDVSAIRIILDLAPLH